jgi:glycosyltransferase involved in cell wall biosynthesis
LRRLIAAHDAVIDFDATFYTMLHECESVINGKPVVGFYHFSIEENLRRAERHTRRQMLGMAGYSNIVVISDTMLDEGRRLFPELSDKFVRIFNGFNLEELRRRAAASNPKDEGATPLSSPYLVSVARLEESQKDITTLIRAYARLKSMMEAMPTEARLPDLVLVGDGRDRDALEALARELKVATKVHFMGFQSDSMPWIGHSEALVLSSKYEGFGLVLVEAMSVGTPVVATNCPSGPAEILEHGASGLLVPVGDEVTMAQNLLHLIVDAEFRAKMGEEALRRSADFDIRLSVAQLMNLVK